jgi:hypothetical protein
VRPLKNVGDSIKRKVKENTNIEFMKEVLEGKFSRNL